MLIYYASNQLRGLVVNRSDDPEGYELHPGIEIRGLVNHTVTEIKVCVDQDAKTAVVVLQATGRWFAVPCKLATKDELDAGIASSGESSSKRA